MSFEESIHVDSLRVACDGGGGPLGHPKVYLQIDPEKGEIVCPYCSRHFVTRGWTGHPVEGPDHPVDH